MGFENVANLEGGFGAWQEAGLPVQRAPRRALKPIRRHRVNPRDEGI